MKITDLIKIKKSIKEHQDNLNKIDANQKAQSKKINTLNNNVDELYSHSSKLYDITTNLTSFIKDKISKTDPRLSDAREALPHTHEIGQIKDLEKIILKLQNDIQKTEKLIPDVYNKIDLDKKLNELKKTIPNDLTPVIEKEVKELYKSITNINQRLTNAINIASEQAQIIANIGNKKTEVIEKKEQTIINQQINLSEIQDLYLQIEKLNQKIKDLSNGKIDFKKIEDKLFDKLFKSVKTTQQVTFVTRNGIQNLSQLKDVNIDTPTNGQTLIYNSITEQWENGSGGGGGGTVNSVVPGENITVDNTDPANPIVASSGQSDPFLTIRGTGILGDEFRYNEYVETVISPTVFLVDKNIYQTFTTDGSTNFDFDYTGITLDDFTFKVFVNVRQPARITLPVFNDLWIGNYQYFTSISSADRGASATIRLKSGRMNITNLCGNWDGN